MTKRKRAVICVDNPQEWIDKLEDYSIMIVNPHSHPARLQYLLDHADWSVLIDSTGQHFREGSEQENERVFWYTSGTTGDSKFCSFSQQQIDLMCQRIIRSYNITSNDRYVSVMPLWHAHGQGFYWATKAAGCKVDFLPATHIRKLEAYDPTFITAIPDVLRLICNQSLPSLRFIRSASSAMPNSLYQELQAKFQIPIIEAFGMTEALSHCFTNPLNGIQKIGTIGLPDGVDASIQQGRLLIKGPTVCADDWYDTGDLAEIDQDGYYRILGRSKDQINVRGIKLNPVSIESQLLATVSGVESCVIFGSNRIKCVYTGPADQKTIVNFLTSLGSHCRPALVQHVDFIPLSPSGKVSRAWLGQYYSNA
jgi:acyl-coenzyme A synthetase/AMP-(fatty) acid ligase